MSWPVRHLSVLQNCIDIVHHQSGNMRNAVEYEIAIRANQSRHLHVFVVDAYIEALPCETFDDLDHGALAQIVRAFLKTEAQNSNAFATFFHDQLEAPCNLQFVARQYGV